MPTSRLKSVEKDSLEIGIESFKLRPKIDIIQRSLQLWKCEVFYNGPLILEKSNGNLEFNFEKVNLNGSHIILVLSVGNLGYELSNMNTHSSR